MDARFRRLGRAAVTLVLLSGGAWHAVHAGRAYSQWMDLHMSQPDYAPPAYWAFVVEGGLSFVSFVAAGVAWRKLTFGTG